MYVFVCFGKLHYITAGLKVQCGLKSINSWKVIFIWFIWVTSWHRVKLDNSFTYVVIEYGTFESISSVEVIIVLHGSLQDDWRLLCLGASSNWLGDPTIFRARLKKRLFCRVAFDVARTTSNETVCAVKEDVSITASTFPIMRKWV